MRHTATSVGRMAAARNLTEVKSAAIFVNKPRIVKPSRPTNSALLSTVWSDQPAVNAG